MGQHIINHSAKAALSVISRAPQLGQKSLCWRFQTEMQLGVQ